MTKDQQDMTCRCSAPGTKLFCPGYDKCSLLCWRLVVERDGGRNLPKRAYNKQKGQPYG